MFTNISIHSRQIKTDESFQPNKQHERKQKAKLRNLMKIYYIRKLQAFFHKSSTYYSNMYYLLVVFHWPRKDVKNGEKKEKNK